MEETERDAWCVFLGTYSGREELRIFFLVRRASPRAVNGNKGAIEPARENARPTKRLKIFAKQWLQFLDGFFGPELFVGHDGVF